MDPRKQQLERQEAYGKWNTARLSNEVYDTPLHRLVNTVFTLASLAFGLLQLYWLVNAIF